MNSKPDYKLFFSLLVVAVVWGTTFLGIRVAVETIPPWVITSMRQGLAAFILLIILMAKKQLSWIGWTNFKHQLIPSVLMIVIANGFTTVAEQSLPSGLTSILSAFSPMVIFVGSIFFGLQKPSIKGFSGVLIGLLGILFIFRKGLGAILDPDYKVGILFLSLGILGWAVGIIYTKKHGFKSDNIFLNLFYQFLIAALIQFVLALIFSPVISVSSWSLNSIIATLYLAVFGSVFAFFCFHYALKKITPVQVSFLNYINTIIAVFLGWLWLDEIITSDFIIAIFLIILGVFIINYKKKIKLDS